MCTSLIGQSHALLWHFYLIGRLIKRTCETRRVRFRWRVRERVWPWSRSDRVRALVQTSPRPLTRTPDRVRFPPNLDFFFGRVGFWTTSTSDSVVGLCPFRQRGIWTLDSVDFATAWTFSVEMSGSGCSASGEPTPTTTPSSCSFTSLSKTFEETHQIEITVNPENEANLDSADLQLHAVCLRIREGVHAPFFLTSHSSATRHQWLNLFSTRHECFTSDVGLTRTRLVSCILLTSLFIVTFLPVNQACSGKNEGEESMKLRDRKSISNEIWMLFGRERPVDGPLYWNDGEERRARSGGRVHWTCIQWRHWTIFTAPGCTRESEGLLPKKNLIWHAHFSCGVFFFSDWGDHWLTPLCEEIKQACRRRDHFPFLSLLTRTFANTLWLLVLGVFINFDTLSFYLCSRPVFCWAALPIPSWTLWCH